MGEGGVAATTIRNDLAKERPITAREAERIDRGEERRDVILAKRALTKTAGLPEVPASPG